MKNSNLVRMTSLIEQIRRWIERGVPGNRNTPERARDVDDLVQWVCLIAVEKLGGIPEDLGESRVRAWLRKTCKNVVKRYRYKLFVEIDRFERCDVVDLELPARRFQLDDEALRRAIGSVWRRLSPQQRDVLQMWADGMAWHEIAQALGISSNAVFQRRKEIIALFEEQNDDTWFGIIPPGILRGQQAQSVAWTVAVAAAIALVLWLTDIDDGDDTPPVPALGGPSSIDEPDEARRGGNGPAPTPPAIPLPTTTTAPQIGTNDAATTSAAVPQPNRKRRVRKPWRAEPRRAPREARAVDAPSTPATATPSLAEQEAELVNAAVVAYHGKDYATAKAHLDEHASRFPTGALATDREKLEVPVLCALGRVSEAEIEGRVLRTRHDPGPLRCELPRRRQVPAQRTQTR